MPKDEPRLLRDQNVIMGTACTDAKNRIVLPGEVVKKLDINHGDDIVFLRVGSPDGSVKGVAAYPGNIIISTMKNVEGILAKEYDKAAKKRKKE